MAPVHMGQKKASERASEQLTPAHGKASGQSSTAAGWRRRQRRVRRVGRSLLSLRARWPAGTAGAQARRAVRPPDRHFVAALYGGCHSCQTPGLLVFPRRGQARTHHCKRIAADRFQTASPPRNAGQLSGRLRRCRPRRASCPARKTPSAPPQTRSPPPPPACPCSLPPVRAGLRASVRPRVRWGGEKSSEFAGGAGGAVPGLTVQAACLQLILKIFAIYTLTCLSLAGS